MAPVLLWKSSRPSWQGWWPTGHSVWLKMKAPAATTTLLVRGSGGHWMCHGLSCTKPCRHIKDSDSPQVASYLWPKVGKSTLLQSWPFACQTPSSWTCRVSVKPSVALSGEGGLLCSPSALSSSHCWILPSSDTLVTLIFLKDLFLFILFMSWFIYILFIFEFMCTMRWCVEGP